jgi:hypothetical protein
VAPDSVKAAFETIALGAGFLVVLVAAGRGVTFLLMPRDPWAALLIPAVGLAVLTIGFQFLTFLMPPHLVVVVLFTAGFALAAVTAARRTEKIPRPDLVMAVLGGAAFFVALMQLDILRGVLTLGGFPSDNIFIYAPAGQYLRDHTSPLLSTSYAVVNPGSSVLAGIGATIPNGLGVFDAASSVLSGLPVYAVFDAVNAFAIATVVGPIWFFMRSALGSSRWAAAVAILLMATNQLLYWAVGSGFQQESLATPIFTAGLGVTVIALRKSSVAAGALAGILGGALVGLYFPIALIFTALAVACLGVHIAVGGKRALREVWRPVAAAVFVATAVASVAVFVLIRSGIGTWTDRLGSNVPAGGVPTFPSLPFLIGALPFAHRWEPIGLPYTGFEHAALPLLVAGSVLIVVVMVLGHWRALVTHHAVEAAILTAGMAIAAYEVVVADFPYGYVKSITYLAPFTSSFIALGLCAELPLLFSRLPTPKRLAAAAAALVAVILISVASLTSSDMVRAFLVRDPTLPTSYLAFSKVDHAVPRGSSVLIDDLAADYGDLVKVAAVAYFLPDRTVRVYVGHLRVGTFLLQDVEPKACTYDFVISAQQPAGDFMLVQELGQGLLVFRRRGAHCPDG